MKFDEAFDILLGHEGGYSNHPSDPGGETIWGITRRVAMKAGYTGDMHVMPRHFAKTIYLKKYWDAVRADELPEVLRFQVFDAAVNSGPEQAVMWLQRALDIGEDGIPGSLTMKAAQERNPMETAVRLNAERLDFMTSLPTWGAFGRGWARRIVGNLREIA
jgi:lysozyme family protein